MAQVPKDNFDDQRLTMLQSHLQQRGISDRRVLAAMARVPREAFVPDASRQLAYCDQALAIDCEQTISQPFMVAMMTQVLQLAGEEKVLEIGTGSGYQTAVLAELARRVISVERHEPLATAAADRLSQLGYENLSVHHADGTLGWADDAPYDRILVTAGAQHYPPALFEQLAEGGRLVIPLGGREAQVLHLIRKTGDQPRSTPLLECRFVPLVGA